MFTVVVELGYQTRAFCRLSDDMFDPSENVQTVFSDGNNPDSAITRLLEDFPIIRENGFRVIGRSEYDAADDLLDLELEGDNE